MADLSDQPRAFPADRAFSEFIRRCKSEIIADWEREARRAAATKELGRLALIDHVPSLLEAIAEVADKLASGGPRAAPERDAEEHVLHRLGEGFDLSQVVAE